MSGQGGGPQAGEPGHDPAKVSSGGGTRAAGAVPRQLPGAVRGFVNRIDDLAGLDEIFLLEGEGTGGAPVYVVTGTAGVGKTSFAVQWARRVREKFPDGQLYVNLRGYDPGEIVSPWRALGDFLAALGVPVAEIPADLEARSALYRSLLADRRMLVLLDNAAEVGQVRPLLPGAEGCLVLVTSRSRLSGLVARDGAYRVMLDVFAEREAVELLQVTTGRYRRGDDAAEMAELAGLCARLPLALRIAAEQAAARPHVPLRALIRDLRDESGLWDALSAEDADEASAVRSVFAWSFRGLTDPAVRLFRLLGLHPGPDFTAAAAAVLFGEPISKVRHQLDVLVGANLLEQVEHDRFRFHDLLRAYAADQAQHEESPEARQAAVRRVLEWYLRSARRATGLLGSSFQRLRSEPAAPVEVQGAVADLVDRAGAVAWLESEWANLRAAASAAVRAGFDEIAWRLPVALHDFYHTHNSFDGRLVMERGALDAARRAGDRRGQAQCLYCLAVSTFQLDLPRQALDLFGQALALYRELEYREGQGLALNSLGFASYKLRAFAEAVEYHRQAADVFRELGDRVWEASTARNAIEAELELGSVGQDAEAVLARALEVHSTTDSAADVVDTLVVLARVRRAAGNEAGALNAAESAVQAGRAAQSAMLEGYALLDLAEIQLAAGSTADALVSAHRSAVVHRALGARGREARALNMTGLIYAADQRHAEAADFHRRAATVFKELGFSWRRARALEHLADALDHTGADDKAQEARREAAAVIAELADT